MTTLDTLPTELLSHIIRRLDAKLDVANTRLVSRRLDPVAAEVLFQTVTLYPQWFTDNGNIDERNAPGPFGYDATIFKNIIEHETLKQLVQKVVLYTVEPDCNYNSHEKGTYPYAPCCQYEDTYLECTNRLNEFPNVKSATLHFDRHVADAEITLESILQHGAERRDSINQILRHFDGRLTGLAVRHYENGLHELRDCQEEEAEKNEESKEDVQLLWRNLDKLTSFRMSVTHVEVCADYGSNRRQCRPHMFWDDFPNLFLQPMQQNLKRLVLYSNMRIGFFPKADFRSIHFPHLESLALGFYTFCKDWQFDWIMAHANTIKEIYLDHCSILHQVCYSISNWLDEDGFPKSDSWPQTQYGYYIEPPRPGDDDAANIYVTPSYATRWHDVFVRFTKEIKNLQTFKFGISKQWNFDTRALCLDQCAETYPIMPWEAEGDIQTQIYDESYLVYIDWEEKFGVEWEFEHIRMDEIDVGTRALLDPPPQCREEDEMALKALLRKIKERV